MEQTNETGAGGRVTADGEPTAKRTRKKSKGAKAREE